MRFIRCLIACLALFGSSLVGQNGPFPQIPLAGIKPYTASIEYENLESFRMERLRLKGWRDIVMDLIPAHRTDNSDRRVSIAFEHINDARRKISLRIFPSSGFKESLDAQTLNLYLQGVARGFGKEAAFEIIDPAEETAGKARFRVAGQKALTLRYAFTENNERIHRGENWIQWDDHICILTVEAPAAAFDGYHRFVKDSVSSMTFED